MPIIPNLPHIKLEGFSSDQDYQYPHTVVDPAKIASQNRAIHGGQILNQLNQLQQDFEQLQNEVLPSNIVQDESIYVEFVSEWNFPLSFSSLHSDTAKPKYQILKVTKEVSDDEVPSERFKTLVMMTKGGISHFIKYVEDYLDPAKDNIKTNKDGQLVNNGPKNNKLFANLSLIQMATLREFWSDEFLMPFPDPEENRWWEVWFRRTDNDVFRTRRVMDNLREIGAQVGSSILTFPEHTVRLVKATANQLSSSLLLLDNLAELRNPQETADCFTREGYTSKKDWVKDLVNRTNVELDDNAVLICLLDTGVNNLHPLIEPFLPNNRMYSYNSAWGNHDSWHQGGHGTGMAGLALYGDLTDAFTTPSRITIKYGLESFKVKQFDVVNDPELYGVIMQNAVNLPASVEPDNRRIFCLSICDPDTAQRGRPSSWSAMIDKLAFGNAENFEQEQLFIISSGNVFTNNHDDYTDLNDTSSIHDPGQSYNALTVGTYTMKDRLDPDEDPGFTLLAPRGGMSPSNSTSLIWDNQWPIKPDIVMEGGNLTTNKKNVSNSDSLQLISTSKRLDQGFQLFGDTSGAAALASKMAAEIATQYPELWPETIRALMVHSADYSPRMLGNKRTFPASTNEKRLLLRRFGYGVPNLERALYSASNSLNLVMERSIKPFEQEGTKDPKYNDYHLYQLPWPAEILMNELAAANVRLKITLSYFIEPNPGDRRWANNFQYHSHGLDFMLIKATEDLDTFKKRVSKASEEESEEAEAVDRKGEQWSLKTSRNRGSLKKDFVTTSGADLALQNVIAVYPKNGWYKTRKSLKRANDTVRYSLIVSIDTDETNVNIYNSVLNQITVPVPSS
ncbi:S8 family peptidase [Mucilaginibacter rubeus]|uniref:S8 family peptidase n=1 Tax=Mucilaginibacter rubeus TaxID=2027860 RepID=UPI0019C8CCDD|nr:S8 family peptidase [Mucilaginibacter rubeus]GGB22870.1 subtilisin proteinase [Mucilaginibacter rubeus]